MFRILIDGGKESNSWQSVATLALGGIGGVLIAQLLTARRETRAKRTELLMELYSEIVEFVGAWHDFLKGWDQSQKLLPAELQQKRRTLTNRLTLLSSKATIDAFESFYRDITWYIDRPNPHGIPNIEQSERALIRQLRDDLKVADRSWCQWFLLMRQQIRPKPRL